MSTTLEKDAFDAFVKETKEKIEQAYKTLQTVDQKFSSINDYQGQYQYSIASSWIDNYAEAVIGVSELYDAIGKANKAGTNIVNTDEEIAKLNSNLG